MILIIQIAIGIWLAVFLLVVFFSFLNWAEKKLEDLLTEEGPSEEEMAMSRLAREEFLLKAFRVRWMGLAERIEDADVRKRAIDALLKTSTKEEVEKIAVGVNKVLDQQQQKGKTA